MTEDRNQEMAKRRRQELESQVRTAANTLMSLNVEGIDIEGLEQRAALLANLSQLQAPGGGPAMRGDDCDCKCGTNTIKCPEPMR